MRDLPWMAVRIDEHARVAAPEGLRRLAEIVAPATRASSITRSTSSGDRVLSASATPPHAPPSVTPLSSASLSRDHSDTIRPPTWKNAVSSTYMPTDQPSRS